MTRTIIQCRECENETVILHGADTPQFCPICGDVNIDNVDAEDTEDNDHDDDFGPEDEDL